MNKQVTDIRELEAIANRLRIQVVKMIACSGVGHAGGAVSMAEILAVLYFREMRYDPKQPGLAGSGPLCPVQRPRLPGALRCVRRSGHHFQGSAADLAPD